MHVRAQNVTVRNFVAPQQIFELLTRDHATVLTQQELENAANRAIQLQQLARTAHFQRARVVRSEEHTSELQSLMRISYAVFCLKKKKTTIPKDHPTASLK